MLKNSLKIWKTISYLYIYVLELPGSTAKIKDKKKNEEIYSCKISNLVYFYQQAIHKNQNENIDVVSFIYLNRYQDILFYVCRSWEKLHHVHKTWCIMTEQ